MTAEPKPRIELLFIGCRENERGKPLKNLWYDLTGISNDGSPLKDDPASGHLDGVVSPEGKPPHVVRGTSRKREYVADVDETENDDGTTTTKTTIAEKIELMVRTVDLSGNIRTFAETDAKE